MKIIYLVRSVPPYWSNRIDVDYIIKALIKKGHTVDIYDIKQRLLFHCNTDDKEIYFQSVGFFDKYPFYLFLNFFVFFRFLIKKRNKYDVLHIFYIREEQLILAPFIHRFAPKLFLTIYGSDFNQDNIIKRTFRKLYKFADVITATNPDILDKLNLKFSRYELKDKSRVVILPQIRFKYYEDFVLEDKRIAKTQLGFNKYKKVIIVGTNATQNEQHLLVIDEISKIEQNNLLFIFLLTYGIDKEIYRNQVKEYCNSKIIYNDYLVYENYMEEEELALLRKAGDIFINLRKNDQFVASMLESFLSGNEVITGSWLPYKILDKLGVSYWPINTISDLNAKLMVLVNIEKEERIQKLKTNKNIISKEYAYNSSLIGWKNLY